MSLQAIKMLKQTKFAKMREDQQEIKDPQNDVNFAFESIRNPESVQLSFSPSVNGQNYSLKKADVAQDAQTVDEPENPVVAPPEQKKIPIQLSEQDSLFFDHMKEKLEVLNKRRHLHPIEIIKRIRSRVSFFKIMRLNDNAELLKVETNYQNKLNEAKFRMLEKMNQELREELREMKKQN